MFFALHDSLISELDTCEIGHWGPRTVRLFSRARERPIPGVKFPPVALLGLLLTPGGYSGCTQETA